MAAAMGIGRFAYTPLLPQMADTFAWTYAIAGDVASANFVGYFTGALLAPLLARSPYARIWLGVSFMLSVATTYLGVYLTDYVAWLLLRFAAGVASACCLVIVTTYLMDTLQRHKAHHLGNIHFAGVGVGILLCMAGVFSGGDIVEQWSRQGFIAAACMALSWILLGAGTWAPPQAAAEEQTVEHAPTSMSLRGIILGYGLFGIGYIVSATFLVAMGEQVAVAGVDSRLTWVAVGVAIVPSVYLWQWFAQRKGLGIALRTSYWVLAVGTVIAGVAPNLWWLMLSALVLGGTFAGVTALGLSAAQAVATRNTAVVVSAMTVAFSVGQMAGPALAGRMADATGSFLWPSLIAGVLVAVAAICVRPDPALEKA